MNPLKPDRMTSTERIDELAEILSVGLSRLRSAQSSEVSQECADHRVDSPVGARMCGPSKPLETHRA